MLQKNYNTSQDKIKRAPTLTASARLITVAKHPGNVGTLIAVPLIFPVLAVLVLVYSVSTTNTLVACGWTFFLDKLFCEFIVTDAMPFPSVAPLCIGRIVLTAAFLANFTSLWTENLHPKTPLRS